MPFLQETIDFFWNAGNKSPRRKSKRKDENKTKAFWKALDEIYKIHTILQISHLKLPTAPSAFFKGVADGAQAPAGGLRTASRPFSQQNIY